MRSHWESPGITRSNGESWEVSWSQKSQSGVRPDFLIRHLMEPNFLPLTRRLTKKLVVHTKAVWVERVVCILIGKRNCDIVKRYV